jgi:hypothetical protein
VSRPVLMAADVEAARQALEAGVAGSGRYHEVAGRHPGVGEAVALPSVAGPGGLPRGRGFDMPEADSVPGDLFSDRP